MLKGDGECYANTFEACLIDKYPNLADNLPLINCIATNTSYYKVQSDIIRCSLSSNLNLTDVNQCTISKKGNDLLYANGVKTRALSPPLRFVPWVTVNGKYTDYNLAKTNLIALVCKYYQVCIIFL